MKQAPEALHGCNARRHVDALSGGVLNGTILSHSATRIGRIVDKLRRVVEAKAGILTILSVAVRKS